MGVYDEPLYYEIAFSYQEIRRQVDFFEEVAKKYGKIHVRRFLEVCCGPSPQLRELAKRGYEVVGLDINPRMLAHLKQRAQEEGVKVETVQADMNDFKLKRKYDFVYALSGSLFVGSNRQFLQHLNCVAEALRESGLYLFENFPFQLWESRREEWTMKWEEIEVKTVFETKVKDKHEQLYTDKLAFEVCDHGEKKAFESVCFTKNFAPQELKSLVELSKRFEFIGWFEHLKLEPWKTEKAENVVILRKE